MSVPFYSQFSRATTAFTSPNLICCVQIQILIDCNSLIGHPRLISHHGHDNDEPRDTEAPQECFKQPIIISWLALSFC